MDTNSSQKKRGSYGRPCDLCASRRVRCETPAGSTSCKKCSILNLPCTHDRVRLKSGPKSGRKNQMETKSSSNHESSSASKRPRLGSSPGSLSVHTSNSVLSDKIPNTFPDGETELLDGNSCAMNELAGNMGSAPFPAEPSLTSSMTPPPFFSPFSHGLRYGTPPFIPNGQPRPPIPTQQFPTQMLGNTGHSNIPHGLRNGMNAPNEMNASEMISPQMNAPEIDPPEKRSRTNTLSDGTIKIDAPSKSAIEGDTFEAFAMKLENHRSSNQNGAAPEPSAYADDTLHAKLSLEHLLSRLQVYQTWFYGYWPILSVAELISVISDGAQLGYENNFITLTPKNAMCYSLCCAVCAAITTQLSFVSSTNSALNCNAISADAYAKEAKRVRGLFEYTDNPDMNTLLVSFFLYAHYVNTTNKTKTATIYLREAISIGQVLNFHTPEFYENKSRAEVHRWRKIYYTFLVTERYMCFECGIPVILDPCVEFPDLDDEEYPSLIYGFTELVKVFSAPGKSFFGELNQNKSPIAKSPESVDKRKWISSVQSQLHGTRELPKNVTQSQRLNIILSEAWIRSIAWRITSENGMLRSGQSNDCFSYDFPVFNVRRFLAQTQGLPEVAFETNGPGVYVKLIEIAKALTSSIPRLTTGDEDFDGAIASKLQDLEHVFSLVTKFKNDIIAKSNEYQAIGNFIFQTKMRQVPRIISSEGRIEELHDGEADGGNADESVHDEAESDAGLTFFQSMNSLKNFGMSPKFGSNVSLSTFMQDDID